MPTTDLLYVSSGNIPSTVTHTIQIMKMCEAFASEVENVSLLTASDLVRWWRGDKPVFDSYGVTNEFPIKRIVLSPYLPQAFFQRSNFPKFGHIARLYIRHQRPRIVYTRNHQAAEFAVKDGFQTIFETHDGGAGNPRTMDFLEKCKDADNLRGVVTTSDTLKRVFADAGVHQRKLLTWPNGVDLQRFLLSGGVRQRSREELGVVEARPLVIYAGSLLAYKGIPTILAAAAITSEVDFLLIGGNRGEVSEWKKKARAIGNLRFLGRVENSALPRYLAAADILIVPNSSSDPNARWTFSLKLYEYLASRRPTIVSDIPSLRSVVTHESNALVIPPDDPEALSGAITRLRDEPGLGTRLADAGYSLVRQFTWQRRARHILETFAPDLMRNRRKL